MLLPAGPTRAPTLKPTSHPTSVVITYSDKEIFGFDVGSRTGNLVTLTALVMVIIWLAVSTAFCITRQGNDPRLHSNKKKKNPKKSRRQKFEEYWGEMDESTNSTTGFNPSDGGNLNISGSTFSASQHLESAPPVISAPVINAPVVSTPPPAPTAPTVVPSSPLSEAVVNPVIDATSTSTAPPVVEVQDPPFVAHFPTIQEQQQGATSSTASASPSKPPEDSVKL